EEAAAGSARQARSSAETADVPSADTSPFDPVAALWVRYDLFQKQEPVEWRSYNGYLAEYKGCRMNWLGFILHPSSFILCCLHALWRRPGGRQNLEIHCG